MTTPYIELARKHVDIISPDSTRFIHPNTMMFEAPLWMARGHYDVREIGCFTYIGEDALILATERIGRYCSIARRLTMGESEHPLNFLSTSPLFYSRRYFTSHPETRD